VSGAGASAAFVSSVTPVVLVGGRSRRFGRDKLLEPLPGGGGVMVERPIGALRAVFGARVALVGACDARVAALGDGVIADPHPGAGPLGGIVSALAHAGGPVLVLAGDMPGVRGEDVARLALAAEGALARGALAVMAESDRVHPCFAVYAAGALAALAAGLARGDRRLLGALPDGRVERWACRAGAAVNVNEPGDLAR